MLWLPLLQAAKRNVLSLFLKLVSDMPVDCRSCCKPF